MSITNSSLMAITMLLLGFNIFAVLFGISGAQSCVGVCLGFNGNNLPSPWETVSLYKSNNIKIMRIYEPNPGVLDALRDSSIELQGSSIELVLGVSNSDLESLTHPENAESWVHRNVVRYWPHVKFKYIVVGSEVNPKHMNALADFVRPALVNVFNAVRSFGLHEKIKVSTSFGTNLMGKSYPPSEGKFRDDIRWYVDPIIGHLVWAKTPILVNIYTYFAYVNDPNVISLPFALFTSPNVVFWDKGLGYQNLFDAMLDAFYSALWWAWGGELEIVVAESGWPSGGGFGASFDNAKTYYTNLLRHVKGGTPKRPNKPIETYLFAMFDENQKEPAIEKNFGLFFPDKRPKYNLVFGGAKNVSVVNNISTTFPIMATSYTSKFGNVLVE